MGPLQGVKQSGPQKGSGLISSWIVLRHPPKALPSSVMVLVTSLQLSVVPSQPHSPAQLTATPFTRGTIPKVLLKPGQVFPVTW
jgi:hypothetical protein